MALSKRAVCISVLFFMSACQRASQGPTSIGSQSPWDSNPGAGDVVVARVEGTPIYSTQVQAHAQAIGASAKVALDDLVSQEILAQEARRRDLGRDPDVIRVRDQALVRRFVLGDFGQSTASPDAIPAEDARPVFERMRDYFSHGPMLRVWNVCTKPEIARKIYDEARRKPLRSTDDFIALAAKNGAAAQMVLTAEDSTRYAPKWRKTLFAALHKPGDLMAPASLPELPFPCTTHVAYCEQAIPARSDTFEQALPEIRKRIYDDWRRKSFLAYEARLAKTHRIERAGQTQ